MSRKESDWKCDDHLNKWTTYLKKFQPIHLPFVPDLNIPDEFDKKIKHIEGLVTYQHKQLAVCHRRFYHIQSAFIQNF